MRVLWLWDNTQIKDIFIMATIFSGKCNSKLPVLGLYGFLFLIDVK